MIRLLSGEWLLNSRPNGGTAVFLRAMWVGGLAYLATIVMSELLRDDMVWSFSLSALKLAAVSHWKVFATSFAASYTAFYARFASQWTYLAGVYNQIMAAKARGTPENDSEAERALFAWQAGFVEDAEELHLATKPMFAGVVKSMLREPGIRTQFIDGTAGGNERLEALESRVNSAFENAAKRAVVGASKRKRIQLSTSSTESTG